MERFMRPRAASSRPPESEGPPGECVDLESDGAPAAKRARVDLAANARPAAEQVDGGACGGDPLTLVSWNVNGLVARLRNEWSRIHAFLEEEKPDLVCLQEVRMVAAGPRGCKRGDGQKRRRGEASRETKQAKEEWQLVEDTLLKAMRKHYTVYWSLADWKYAGTAMLVRRPLKPSRVRYTLPALVAGGHSAHVDKADSTVHPDGRIILASFETFDVLATYAPNNGNDLASFARRAAWDEALRQDLSGRSRPIIWMGDLNCAAEPVDVSHPEWFLQQCYQGDPEDMRGQPGFTPGERQRFLTFMKETRMVDAYRMLHPASISPPAGGPHYTWRGSPPVHQPVARYHGKGMRIDYHLVSEDLVPRVQDSAILGHGEGRVGFMGSDHCPVRLELSPGES